MRIRKQTIWAPLTAGFAVVVALIALATGITLTQSFLIFDLLTSAYDRHREVARALESLRSNIYLAGLLKRDFLLDPTSAQTVNYGQQFAEIQESSEESLATMERGLGPGQSEAVGRLRVEVSAFLTPLREALDWDPIKVPSLRVALLRGQVRQRTAALRMAAEIEELNQDSLREQQQRIHQAEESFRQTLYVISGVSLLVGAGVAVFTILHTRRLELQAQEVRSELKRLSQHVVQAQEMERRNISRELHDEVGQLLTGLRMELANLDGPALERNAADYQRLQEAKRLAERTLQCVRNLSLLLRPSMLDDLGLSPALQWQGREFSRRTGLPVHIGLEGDVDSAPEEVRTCVYRVVQEALTNVARHAAAKRIDVVVRRVDDELAVSIEDDGKGFDPARPGGDGIGLVGLKERVTDLAGIVSIESGPGKGTRIRVRLPLENGAAPA
ncbi:MAG: sensor histidine kinase [Bryobacteraceae bacterium]|nr:sensor histidine kinase [Bryobacteraceae bacterium]